MKNKTIIPTILFTAVMLFSFFALSQEKNKNQAPAKKITTENQSSSQIILFYGDGCPHCAIVEEYINENNIQDKVPFVQKEVITIKAMPKSSKPKQKFADCRLMKLASLFFGMAKNA